MGFGHAVDYKTLNLNWNADMVGRRIDHLKFLYIGLRSPTSDATVYDSNDRSGFNLQKEFEKRRMAERSDWEYQSERRDRKPECD
jgi:hypothetical protein